MSTDEERVRPMQNNAWHIYPRKKHFRAFLEKSRIFFTYTESNVAPNVSFVFLLSSFVFSYGLVIAIVQLQKIYFPQILQFFFSLFHSS